MCKVLWILLAFIVPPIAVLFDQGCTCDFWINLLLTCLFFIPGVIHAIYVIIYYDNKRHGYY